MEYPRRCKGTYSTSISKKANLYCKCRKIWMLTKTHFNSILMVLVVPISPTNNLILTSTNHKMTQFKCRSIPLRLIMVNLFSQVNRRNIIMILCSSMIVETPFLQACRSFNNNPKTVLMQSMMVIFSTRNHSISASKT